MCMINNVSVKPLGTHHLGLYKTGLHLATHDQLAHLSSICHLCEQQKTADGVILILQDNGESHAALPLPVGRMRSLDCLCSHLLTEAHRVQGKVGAGSSSS